MKQAAIRSVDFFEWHERNADRLHARGGAVRYVLLKTLGETELVADVGDGEVGAGLGVIQPE